MYRVNLIVDHNLTSQAYSAGGGEGRNVLGDPKFLLFIAVILASVIGTIYMDHKTAQKYDALFVQVDKELRDSTVMEENVILANKLRVQSKEIEDKMALIGKIDEGRYIWPHIFEQMALATPGDVWLTEWEEVERKNESGTMELSFRLKGNSASNELLATFIQSLESSAFIKEVSFTNSEAKKIASQTALEFIIEAKSEQPDRSLLELETIGPEGRVVTQKPPPGPVGQGTGAQQDTINLPWLPQNAPTAPRP